MRSIAFEDEEIAELKSMYCGKWARWVFMHPRIIKGIMLLSIGTGLMMSALSSVTAWCGTCGEASKFNALIWGAITVGFAYWFYKTLKDKRLAGHAKSIADKLEKT